MAARVLVASFLFLTAFPLASRAQQSVSWSSLTDTQKQGDLVFRQHCLICHAKPMGGNSKYGPRLSKEFVIGREAIVRRQIMEGSEHMPGFKYGLQPAQVDAIVEYLKTVDKADVDGKGKPATDGGSTADN